MTFFLLSMVLVGVTISVVRPAMDPGNPIPVTGASLRHITLLATAFVAVALAFDVATAAALAIAFTTHEAGLVLGHRLAGHGTVRYRLAALPRGGPVSPAPHADDLEQFFVTLMGPALGLAPMVLAFALSDLFADGALHHLFGRVALTLGAFNFLALLPVWPLPGGTLVQLILRPGHPRVGSLPVAAIFAGLIALSWHTGSPTLSFVTAIGAMAFAIRPAIPADRHPMTLHQLGLAIPAYLATLSAFFLGGWWVLLFITHPL
ncbi:hypothetical protein GQE99_17435 [Maritimibacter sp. DP07]|uniref:Zn-dependent protease (Includes SpoIVFB) n=1 Tax=Maritimibacter harenae TaxID=2606218 RepID=A0A845M9M7_9RHOB|nr:hypothetical protein [Maritimibacter harenae]MZR14807.1 hypothetical protein [Maritimibacter harenae]